MSRSIRPARPPHVARPGSRFCVLLGSDHAGKQAVLAELAAGASPLRVVSVDQAQPAPEHQVLADLRRHLVRDILPRVGSAYSGDFVTAMVQLDVLHLRDRVLAAGATPVLVDSYYYELLARCRLAGMRENPMFGWWRTFPQPVRVFYLDVTAETARERRASGNLLECYGDAPDWGRFDAYQADLREAVLGETAHLPVTVIDEQRDTALTAKVIGEALTDEFG